MKSKIKAGLSIIGANVTGKKTPLSVSIRSTFRCNIACKYCQVWKTDKSKEELSTKDYYKLFDELESLGTKVISLTGGEPLLRKDIDKIVSYAKSKSFYLVLASNGKLVPKKVPALKKLDLLLISLDGPKNIHDKQRGTGSFKAAIEAVKAAKKNNIPAWISTVVTKENLRHVDEILELSKELGVTVNMQPLMQTWLTRDGISNLELSEKDFKNLYSLLIKRKKEGYDIAYTDSLLKFFLKTDGQLEKMNLKCFAGKLFYVINPNGDLYPCAGLVEEVKTYNVKELGFKKAMESMEEPKCKSCTFTCYIQKNLLFSLDLKSISYAIKNFKI